MSEVVAALDAAGMVGDGGIATNAIVVDHVYLLKIPYIAEETGKGEEKELFAIERKRTVVRAKNWWRSAVVETTEVYTPLPKAIREYLPENAEVLSVVPDYVNSIMRVYYTRGE